MTTQPTGCVTNLPQCIGSLRFDVPKDAAVAVAGISTFEEAVRFWSPHLLRVLPRTRLPPR